MHYLDRRRNSGNCIQSPSSHRSTRRSVSNIMDKDYQVSEVASDGMDSEVEVASVVQIETLSESEESELSSHLSSSASEFIPDNQAFVIFLDKLEEMVQMARKDQSLPSQSLPSARPPPCDEDILMRQHPDFRKRIRHHFQKLLGLKKENQVRWTTLRSSLISKRLTMLGWPADCPLPPKFNLRKLKANRTDEFLNITVRKWGKGL